MNWRNPMHAIHTDPETGAEIFRLTDDPRPADNIYGEQPYASADGSRIVVRYYPSEGAGDGSLVLLDLSDGSQQIVIDTAPRFPAFHGWGTFFYGQEQRGDRLILRRWDYLSAAGEDVADLPTGEGRFSYGTVSADGKHYVVSVHGDEGAPCRVLHVDLETGEWRQLVSSTERYFKHEQFSRDGRDRVMLQANSQDVSRVGLAAASLDGELSWFAADAPHTLRPTGHEAWVGDQSRVFFSTAWDPERGNLWTAGLEDPEPTPLGPSIRGGHVSVSRCGRYALIDNAREDGTPLYLISLASGRWQRLVDTGTVSDRNQWSHAHPYLTADNAWAVFTSNREGHPQVYAARVPDGLLASLA
jgi:hypothetical protein